eukprot:scaffold158338_cov34-Tisochrysis_lutea.AAC.3
MFKRLDTSKALIGCRGLLIAQPGEDIKAVVDTSIGYGVAPHRLTTRFTLDRQQCLPPGPGALSECLNYDSQVPKCEGMAIVSCNTGKSCAAPFEYQGKPAWSCVGVGIGSKPEYCTTVDGEWQQCAALVKNINRMTSAGDQCVLPFEFGGVGYYDCLGVDPATGNPGFCK